MVVRPGRASPVSGDAQLYSGFATHVWIDGNNGTLLAHAGS